MIMNMFMLMPIRLFVFYVFIFFRNMNEQIRIPLFAFNFTYELSNFIPALTGGPLGAVGLMPACCNFS
jgi:hypothetical protein